MTDDASLSACALQSADFDDDDFEGEPNCSGIFSEPGPEEGAWWKPSRRKLVFIHPFVLDDSVALTEEDLTAKACGSLWYKDPATAALFRIFRNRSLLGPFRGVMYGLATALCAVLPILTHVWQWFYVIMAVTMFSLSFAEVYAHVMLDPMDSRVARTRSLVSLTLALAVALVGSFPHFRASVHCDEALSVRALLREGKLTDPEEADMSRDQLLQLCLWMVHPTIFGTPSTIVLGLDLLPLKGWGVLSASLVIYLLAPLSDLDALEPWRVYLIKLVLFSAVLLAMGAAVLLRHWQVMTKFEVAVRTHMRTLEARHRGEELENLTVTLVPLPVLPRLLNGGPGRLVVDVAREASVMFSDMKSFTAWSSTRSARQVVTMLNLVVGKLDALAWEDGWIDKLKTIGDAYWAVSGIPEPNDDHAARLCAFGFRFHQAVAQVASRHPEFKYADGTDMVYRVAVHTGPMNGALFGLDRVGYEVFGHTQRVVQAMEAGGVAGHLCTSEAAVEAALHCSASDSASHFRECSPVEVDGMMYPLYMWLQPAGKKVSKLVAGGRRVSEAALLGRKSVLIVRQDLASSKIRSSRSPSTRISVSCTTHSTEKPVENKIDVKAFIQRQLKKAGGGGDNADQRDAMVIAAEAGELAGRRARTFPMAFGFADKLVEKRFAEWTLESSAVTLRFAAIFTAAFAALIAAAELVQQVDMFAVGFVLQGLAAFLALASSVFVRWRHEIWRRSPPVIRAAGVWIPAILLFLGGELSIIGAGLVASDSVVGRDVVFAFLFPAGLLMLLVGPLPWWTVMILACGIQGITAYGFEIGSPEETMGIIIGMLWSAVMLAVTLATEIVARRTFVEVVIGEELEQSLQRNEAARLAVLAAVVPDHVTADLLEWFKADMDPSKAVAHDIDRTLIGFIRLAPPEERRSHIVLMALEKAQGSESSASEIGESAAGDMLELVQHEETWVPATHAVMEVLLQPCRSIEKVKTIGDTVMVGGPFTAERGSTEDAAGEVVRLVAAVEAEMGWVQAGFHVGPVFGAVQGTSRLCFDVFGDVVNVASRVFTGVGGGAAAVSADVAELLGPGAPLGPAETFAAKGRGELVLHRLKPPE